MSWDEQLEALDNLYNNLLTSESGAWSLSEVNEADYYLLMELFGDDKKKSKKEDKVDAMSFFGSILPPSDFAKVKE